MTLSLIHAAIAPVCPSHEGTEGAKYEEVSSSSLHCVSGGLDVSIDLDQLVGLPATFDTRLYPLSSPFLFGIGNFETDTQETNFSSGLLGFNGAVYDFSFGYQFASTSGRGDYAWVVEQSESMSENRSTVITTTYYPITGPQYEAQAVTVDVSLMTSGGAISSGTDYFGDDYYYVPAGMDSFIGLGYRYVRYGYFEYTTTQDAEGVEQGLARDFFRNDRLHLSLLMNTRFDTFGVHLDGVQAYQHNLFGLRLYLHVSAGLYWRTTGGGLLQNSLYVPLFFTVGYGGMPVGLVEADEGWQD